MELSSCYLSTKRALVRESEPLCHASRVELSVFASSEFGTSVLFINESILADSANFVTRKEWQKYFVFAFNDLIVFSMKDDLLLCQHANHIDILLSVLESKLVIMFYKEANEGKRVIWYSVSSLAYISIHVFVFDCLLEALITLINNFCPNVHHLLVILILPFHHLHLLLNLVFLQVIVFVAKHLRVNILLSIMYKIFLTSDHTLNFVLSLIHFGHLLFHVFHLLFNRTNLFLQLLLLNSIHVRELSHLFIFVHDFRFSHFCFL